MRDGTTWEPVQSTAGGFYPILYSIIRSEAFYEAIKFDTTASDEMKNNMTEHPVKYSATTIFCICLLISIITFFAYLPTLGNDFINLDDPSYLFDTPFSKTGFSLSAIKWAFTSIHVSNWHPVTWISHMIDCEFFGLNPKGHHAVSLLFHILNSMILFLVLRKMTDKVWPCSMIALFFAVHPMHVESVAWVAERKDLLSMFFMLISLWFYVSFSRYGKLVSYRLSLMFFAMSLLSKPMGVTFPFLLIVLDFWPLNRFDSNHTKINNLFILTKEKTPFFILSLFSVFMTIWAQKAGGAIGSTDLYPLFSRIENSILSYFKYAYLLFYPQGHAIVYPYPKEITTIQIAASATFLGVITFVAIMNSKTKPYLISGWLWFTGTLVPVIGIIQVGLQAMADRYTYIPYTGLFIMLFFLIDEYRNKWSKTASTIINSSVIVVMILFILLSNAQTKAWKNAITILEQTLKNTKNNYVAHLNLGGALVDKKRIHEAIEHFEAAASINQQTPIPHGNIGVCWTMLNEPEKALNSLQIAIKRDGSYQIGYYLIGKAYRLMKKDSEAEASFTKALSLNPNDTLSLIQIGRILMLNGQNEKALKYLNKAASLGNPNAISLLQKINTDNHPENPGN